MLSSIYTTHISYISFTNFALTVYIQEFLTSVERVCQICGALYTIESIPYFAVDLQLVINDLGLLKEYGQSFFLNISLTIGGDQPFIKFIDFCHENMYIFDIFICYFKKFAETRIAVIVNYS